jgi:hypothetical protein
MDFSMALSGVRECAGGDVSEEAPKKYPNLLHPESPLWELALRFVVPKLTHFDGVSTWYKIGNRLVQPGALVRGSSWASLRIDGLTRHSEMANNG